METNHVELIALADAAKGDRAPAVQELNELQLMFVGGGSADPLFS